MVSYASIINREPRSVICSYIDHRIGDVATAREELQELLPAQNLDSLGLSRFSIAALMKDLRFANRDLEAMCRRALRFTSEIDVSMLEILGKESMSEERMNLFALIAEHGEISMRKFEDESSLSLNQASGYAASMDFLGLIDLELDYKGDLEDAMGRATIRDKKMKRFYADDLPEPNIHKCLLLYKYSKEESETKDRADQIMMKYLKRYPGLTERELSLTLEVKAHNHLKRLMKEGIVDREKSKKAYRYHLKI